MNPAAFERVDVDRTCQYRGVILGLLRRLNDYE